MKRLLKIKFSVEKKFPVRVRVARLAEKAGRPVRQTVLVILPDGNVVRCPDSSRSLPKNSPRCGSLESGALPPWQSRPARVRASAAPRHLTLSPGQVADGEMEDAAPLPAPHSIAERAT